MTKAKTQLQIQGQRSVQTYFLCEVTFVPRIIFVTLDRPY